MAHNHDGVAATLHVPVYYLSIVSQQACLWAHSARGRAVNFVRHEVRELRHELNEDKCLIRCHSRRAREAVRDGVHRAVGSLTPCRPAPQTFPYFSRLPAEIRLQIWDEALPGPRAVMIRSPLLSKGTKLRSRLGLSNKEQGPAVWSSTTPPPALLHVNSESRLVALQRYKLGLGVGDMGPRVYLDFERDYIALSRGEINTQCEAMWKATADAAKVRHLALPYWGYNKYRRLPILWARLTKLENLMMVRSIRWQNGKLPKKAVEDFLGWSDREKRAAGIRHWHATWADGNITITDGTSSVTVRYLPLDDSDDST